MSDIQLSASLIAADFYALGEAIEKACEAGVDGIHIDVMDHHFVPNLSIGPMVAESLGKHHIPVPMDVHLMVTDPDAYIEPFAKAGASCVTFHPKTSANVQQTLEIIKRAGMQAGIALNPDDSLTLDPSWLPHLDMILMMSVHPGFCGQLFIPKTLDRLSAMKAELNARSASHVCLAIDGGINVETLPKAYEAGARFFVVGSALFGADDLEARVSALRGSVTS